MIGMTILLNGDGAWPDLRNKKEEDIIHIANDAPAIQVAVLEHGMVTGRPSVALRIELPDGKTLLIETTARLFCTAGKMIDARYPNLFKDDA